MVRISPQQVYSKKCFLSTPPTKNSRVAMPDKNQLLPVEVWGHRNHSWPYKQTLDTYAHKMPRDTGEIVKVFKDT